MNDLETALNKFIQAVDLDKNKISDGYHTIGELYDHRIALFLFIVDDYPDSSWWSLKHSDGTSIDGWIVAGIHLNAGDISYHLPIEYVKYLKYIPELGRAPKFDGHTSRDVVERLLKSVEDNTK